MKLSTKGRYAMVALADLAMVEARSGGDDLVSLAAISKRQDISLPYLEQLFVKLRRAGLVEAVRGPGGGYKLARSATEIRISEVMEAVEETVDAMHTGAGAFGAVSGSPCAVADQPAVGKPVGQRLCLPASGAAVGRGEERPDARARRCRICFAWWMRNDAALP
jgi:Rrf2 family protein